MAPSESGEGDEEGEGHAVADETPQTVRDEDDPMNPAAWYGEPDVCGSCIAWRPDDPRPGEDVAAGVCKLRRELGRVPATLKKCNIYKPRGQFRYEPGREPAKVRKRAATLRVLRRSEDGELQVARAPKRAEVPSILKREKDVELVEENELVEPRSGDTGPRPERERRDVPRLVELGGDESPAAVRQALVELLRREHGRQGAEIHSKFRTGGKVVARAQSGARVEISAERFFSFLDRFRSALGALEEALDACPALAEERAELTGLLLKMQGSFTTFNVLFQDREDYFSGKE